MTKVGPSTSMMEWVLRTGFTLIQRTQGNGGISGTVEFLTLRSCLLCGKTGERALYWVIIKDEVNYLFSLSLSNWVTLGNWSYVSHCPCIKWG